MDLIDIGLYGSYILIVLCALAAIIIPLVQSFSDPKSLVKSGIGLAGIVVVFVISYVIADGGAEGTTEQTSKMVGAGIISMYIFFAIAIIGIFFTEISKIVK